MLGLNQYNPFFGFSSLYQFIHMSNLIFQAKVNKINGITKTNVEYEVQFKKNLELIKEKFRKEIKTELSFDEVVKSTEKLRVFKESTKK